MTRSDRRVWTALAAGLAFASVLAGLNLASRVRVESANRRVGLAVEWSAVQEAAALAGLASREVLEDLREAGATHVVLEEETVGPLLSLGTLRLVGSLLVTPEEWRPRVRAALGRRFGPDRVRPHPEGFLVRAPASVIGSTGLGLNPSHAEAIRGAGLRIVARFAAPSFRERTGPREILGAARDLGAEVFLPSGDRVLGFPGALENTAAALRALGLLLASPEFVSLAGLGQLARDVPDRTIRLHSIQAAETIRLTPSAARERYVRAARERNVRLLLVRPVPDAETTLDGALVETVRDVRAGLEREGLRAGPPEPFADPAPPRWIAFALAVLVGLLAAGLWILAVPSPLGRRAGLVLIALLPLAHSAEIGPPLVPLLAAVLFPVLGYLLPVPSRPVLRFLAMSAVSIVGGLVVAALLNSQAHLIKADQFVGVKAAHALPVLIVALWALSRVVPLAEAARAPVTWGIALAFLAVLAAFALMITRTGNENPAAVPDLELRFRAALEALLPVRPRTKEFLVGHPALILGLALARGPSRPVRLFSAAALTVGAIGQASIVNTFCHLHTPLALSAARVGVGLVLGGIVGVIAVAIVRRWIAPSGPGREGGPRDELA